jgi:NAD(P)H-nitrite reductase large subunit
MTLDPIICGCYDVHKSTIATAIREKGYRTVDQINKEFFLDKACGNCKDEVREVLKASKGD